MACRLTWKVLWARAATKVHFLHPQCTSMKSITDRMVSIRWYLGFLQWQLGVLVEVHWRSNLAITVCAATYQITVDDRDPASRIIHIYTLYTQNS